LAQSIPRSRITRHISWARAGQPSFG